MSRRPPPNPEVLFTCRLAVRALGLALEELGLAAACIHLNPDDSREALGPTEAGEVLLFEPGAPDWPDEPAARVNLGGGSARVTVGRLERLVRASHRGTFDLGDIGLAPEPGRPDIDLEVDLGALLASPEAEALRTMPPRPLPPPMRRRPTVARVIRSCGRNRR